ADDEERSVEPQLGSSLRRFHVEVRHPARLPTTHTITGSLEISPSTAGGRQEAACGHAASRSRGCEPLGLTAQSQPQKQVRTIWLPAAERRTGFARTCPMSPALSRIYVRRVVRSARPGMRVDRPVTGRPLSLGDRRAGRASLRSLAICAALVFS